MKNSAHDNNEYKALLKGHFASDEVHRIIPLGLTLGEARAWYRNHVLLPQLRCAIIALAGGVVLLSTLSTLREPLDATLTAHMIVEPSLLAAAGFILAYAVAGLAGFGSPYYVELGLLRRIWRTVNWEFGGISVLMFVAAASLIAFSSTPAQFAATAPNANTHVELHAAFLLAGALIFVGARPLSMRVKLLLPVIVGKAMGLYGMLLLLTPVAVYAAYPVYEQADAGIALLALMVVLDFTLMPLWLYNYFNGAWIRHAVVAEGQT